MTWTYDAANLTSNAGTTSVTKDQVRFLVGDTRDGDQLLQDEEILFTISMFPNIFRATMICCDNLAAFYSRKADSVQGPLHTSYSQQSKAFAAAAARYSNLANIYPSASGYAGGISIADKQQQDLDNDRVPPNFNIGMDDNFFPIAPAGNESVDIPSDTSQLGP